MRSSNNTSRFVKAIREAQSYWGAVAGEPFVNRDEFLRLREVCNALESLLGNLRSDRPNGYDQKAYRVALEALVSGELVAVTMEENAVIPSHSWSDNLRQLSRAPEVGLSSEKYSDLGFWCGTIQWEHECKGFVGKLPVVPFHEAELWLQKHSPKMALGRPSKKGSAVQAYQSIYPEGHGALGHNNDQAALAVSEKMGEAVSWRTIHDGLKKNQEETP